MIRLKNILLEQKGSFKDLPGDYYSVMSGPIPIGGISSFESELAGFKFNSDSTVATKEYLLKPLVLTWLGSETFNVKYGGKNLGTYDIDKFEKWLNDMNTKRGGHLKVAPTLEKLKSLGFEKGKDPETGRDSYVKLIKTWWAATATKDKPNGYWTCTTAIRVFYRSDDNWMIRARIIPDSFDDRMLQDLKGKDISFASNRRLKTKTKKTSWLTGSEYEDYEDYTPEMQADDWNESIDQAVNRIQRVPATTRSLIDKVSKIESDIIKYKGLVGPYDDPKFSYNYLMQIVKKIKA